MLGPRFWSKVEKTEGCWIWTAARNAKGYGYFRIGGRTRKAHRLAYEDANGPVADGLVLDHLCRTPSCVRPDHLEAVTSAENTRRGEHGAQEACQRGHPFDEANTHTYRGRRVCRACRRARKARTATRR